MKKYSKKIISGIFILLIVAFFYSSCVPHKLNEEVFYKDENIELKVVRYLEVLPLHYVGPTVRIGCRSKNTQPQAWHKIQDNGWTEIYNHSSLIGGDPDLKVLALSAKSGYHVTDVDTMIYQSQGLSIKVTWDACGSFSGWSANDMPEKLMSQEGYIKCLKELNAKKTKGYYIEGFDVEKSCKAQKFYKVKKPLFSNLNAKSSGYASFIVSSKTFLTTESYRVETHNYGKSWDLVPIQGKYN